jgi:hypothetical protein
MSWNSTHTAITAIAAITIAGMHYGASLVDLLPFIGPLGIYIGLREKSRVKVDPN